MKTLASPAPISSPLSAMAVADRVTTTTTESPPRAKLVLGPLVVDGRSLTAALLSGIALIGRILMLLTDGPASAMQLVAVLLIGASACALGTHAVRERQPELLSRLLGRVGQRAGAVQVVLSLISLALLV